MRWVLLASLLLAGCAKEQVATQPVLQTTAPAKVAKTSYTPSELEEMNTPPEGVISVWGRVIYWDKEINQNGKLFLSLANVNKSVSTKEKTITVVFEPMEDGTFSGSVLTWFDRLRLDIPVSLKGKIRKHPDGQSTYLICSEIVN